MAMKLYHTMAMKKIFILIITFILSLKAFSQIGIGTNNPHSFSNLDITSTSKGLLLPRMTVVQRNAINGTAGLQVWCTDCVPGGILQIFNGTSWVNSAGSATTLSVPSSPINPVATILGYTSVSVSFSPPANNGGSIVANYTITSSPGNITVTGSSSPITISGLPDGANYTFSVVATNITGSSLPSSTSSAISLPTISGNADCSGSGNTDIVELTSSTGKIWMDRNLGASRAPNSSSDYYAFGCLYQWGRGNDDHASINWNSATSGTPVNASISTLSSTDASNSPSFITNTISPFDWLSNQNSNLWQYSTGTNNPCPSGFRLPTAAEYAIEFSVYDITNATTAYANGPGNGFKFLTPGSRLGSDGLLINTGSSGNYWTQTINNTNATAITIANSISNSNSNRTNGLSVRCIKGNINNETLTVISYPQDGKILLQFNSIANATDYVIYYKINSGTAWSIYNDGVNTNLGVTINGLSNGILYDFMVKAIVSNNTNVYSSLLTKSPSAIIDYNVYHQIILTGQSNASGAGSATMTTLPLYQNKKINTVNNPTSLIPLVEPNGGLGGGETISSATANYISSSTYNTVTHDNFKSIVTLSSLNGGGYASIKKGSFAYNYAVDRVKDIKNILHSQNLPYIGSAITLIHGEADYNEAAATYKSWLVELQNDYQTDIRKITGQTDAIPMFLCQTSSISLNNYVQPKAVIGQLAAAEENPTKIFLVTPKYLFDYCDAVHFTGPALRRLGEYYGKVMKKVLVDGEAWKPLSPSSVSITANVITVNFNVPVAPLQFDTVKVMSTAKYGFEYYDATNSATITNVAIGSNGTSVIVTLSNTPTGSNKKIAYAYSSSLPGGLGGGRNVTGSPKGNLRDSDTTPALYTTGLPTNFGTELNNWCVHFIKDLN